MLRDIKYDVFRDFQKLLDGKQTGHLKYEYN